MPERRLSNFRVSRAFQLIAESQSHFERSKRVKRFIEVSLRRLHPEICRVRSRENVTMTRCGMHFALGADTLDLYSTYERAVAIEHIFD